MRRGFPIFVIMVLVAQGCTDMSEPGVESLEDPNIKPKVISTYPPMNSQGPYVDVSDYRGNSYPIEIRFNKIMDRVSVVSGFSFTSSLNKKYIVDNDHVQTYGGDLYYFNPFDSVYWNYYSYSWAKLKETFTLTFSSNTKDINGNPLLPPFSTTFIPEPYFRIKRVFPSDGAVNFPADYSISISLNSPIDHTFFDYISINPLLEGQWIIPSHDSMNINYDYNILPANQTYTITVREGAPDKYGNQLTSSFSSSFSTTNFFIIDSYPEVNNAFINSMVRIWFSASMDTSTLRRSFNIIPNIEGTLDINERLSIITFHPEPELLPNTYYTVIIDTSLKSANGYHLSEPYTFTFNTPVFTVCFQNPNAFNANVSVTSIITLRFTADLDTNTIRSAFNIDPQVTGSLWYEYHEDYILFHPKYKFDSYTTYTVTIDSTLRSIGGLHLPKPHIFSFATSY